MLQHTWFHLGSFRSVGEDCYLAFVTVEPSDHSIVDLKVILSTCVGASNGIKNRVATSNILQVDPSTNAYTFKRFGLEGIAVEEDITTVCVGSVAAFAIFEVHQDGTSHHVTIVGIA